MQQSYSNTNTVNVSVYITANVVNINLGGDATRVIGGMNVMVLRSKELSRSTKLKVVMPTLLYVCETWSLSKRQSKVQAAQMNVLRMIEGVSRLDRVRNVDVREKLRQEGV